MQAAAIVLVQNKKTTHSNEYIPGVCNIGEAERAKRRLTGLISTIAAVILLAFLLTTDTPHAWRLLLVLPIASAASGFLQDAMHFCAGFGFKGVFNVINSAGITDNVQLEEFRRKDRAKALQITGFALLIGTTVALISLLLPL